VTIYKCDICGVLLEYREREQWNSRFYCPTVGGQESQCLQLAKRNLAWKTQNFTDIWDDVG
jgi:hypothetical protein